jgi:hypothetical protein
VQQLRGEAITVRAEGLPEAAAPNLKNKSFTTLGYGDIVPHSKRHAAWPLWKPLRANSIAL